MATYTSKVPSILPRVRELETLPVPIVAVAREYPSGHLVERHQHDRAQLIYASKGIMRVDTPQGIWVVPPMRAIWVPPGIDHEIRASSAVCLRTLFIRPAVRPSLPHDCCVIEVSPLLRELILRMVSLAGPEGLDGASPAEPRELPSVHLIELILDEIREIKVLPLHIPMPRDVRALRICQGILDDPSDGKTCAQWGVVVGASSRTLERLFYKEVGMSFASWRRQARLLAALSRLAADTPIAAVALDLGYESPSAFTAMFRRTLGRPPSEFFPRESATS